MIVRWTEKAPVDFKRRLSYRTRRMLPDDRTELNANEAAVLINAGFAEAVDAEEPVKSGPGRPKKTASQSQPEASQSEPAKLQPYLTRQELLGVAGKRGVELPPGYVTRDELAKLVGDVSPEELEHVGD